MDSKRDSIEIEQRAYIKIRTLLGDTPKNIYDDLASVYNYVLSYSSVNRWLQQFHHV